MTDDLRARIIEAFNTAYEPWPVEVAPDIVKMSRHDGHGFQGACYVCRGDVDKLADAVLTAVGSWQGLMSLLDEHWPATVFKGSTEDPGPTIVFLLREVDRLRREVEFEARSEEFYWTPPSPSDPCACISEDQASQLGPGFSRPVCAVHQPKRLPKFDMDRPPFGPEIQVTFEDDDWVDPTVEAVGGDALSGTPWAEGGETE